MMLKVRTNDDVVMKVDSEDVAISNLFQVLVPSIEGEEEIPLYNVSFAELKKIIEFTSHYRIDRMNTIPKPLSNTLDLGVQSWYYRYVSSLTTDTTLFDILRAAAYLDIEPLQELICARIASLLRGKECDELKKIFGLDYGL